MKLNCDEPLSNICFQFQVAALHLGRANAALRVAEAGLADSWVRCGHRLGLQRRALRLGKRCKRWAVAAAPWRADAEWEARPATQRPFSHQLEPFRP